MFLRSHRARVAATTLIAATVAVITAPSATSYSTPNQTASQSISQLLTSPATPWSGGGVDEPPGFVRTYGYAPQVRDGLIGDPLGGCSSPIPLPAEFTPACRQHDLGYDLLRYAHDRGAPLPPTARRALDARLGAQLRDACEGRTSSAGHAACACWAAVAEQALRFNTWRQLGGAPIAESPRSILMALGVVVAALGTGGLIVAGLMSSSRSRRPEGAVA